jgi:hypothetical protein
MLAPDSPSVADRVFYSTDSVLRDCPAPISQVSIGAPDFLEVPGVDAVLDLG